MFFEPLPEPEEEPRRERWAQPPWLEKPRGVVFAGVPLVLTLVRKPKIAIALSRLGACPDGFEADLIVLAKEDLEDELRGGLFGQQWRHRGERIAPDQALRFGVQYADGSKAELGESWRAHDKRPEPHDARPQGPIIRAGGGRGGDGEQQQQLWFWPLPPPGTITFALEWRAQGIDLQLHELDAAPIREAAQHAQILMPGAAIADTPHHSWSIASLHMHEEKPN